MSGDPPARRAAAASPAEAEPDPRLGDLPDWGYLLREFQNLYRDISTGGSPPIRAHQRAVREAVGRIAREDRPLRFRPPAAKPVTAHLRRALDEGLRTPHPGVIRAVDAVREALDWQYGYEKVPRGLSRKFAYAEIAGPNGPVPATEVILGLVLFAPGCTYPAHAHQGIAESYVCLSGAVSENHQGVYAPGSMILNPPGHAHRITVSDRGPGLLAYAWTGPPEALAGQKMRFGRARRTG